MRQSIQPFVKELGLDDIISKLADFQSPSAAEHCRETLQLVMDNAVETVKNKILDLLETVAEKVHCPFHLRGDIPPVLITVAAKGLILSNKICTNYIVK